MRPVSIRPHFPRNLPVVMGEPSTYAGDRMGAELRSGSLLKSVYPLLSNGAERNSSDKESRAGAAPDSARTIKASRQPSGRVTNRIWPCSKAQVLQRGAGNSAAKLSKCARIFSIAAGGKDSSTLWQAQLPSGWRKPRASVPGGAARFASHCRAESFMNSRAECWSAQTPAGRAAPGRRRVHRGIAFPGGQISRGVACRRVGRLVGQFFSTT